jgi:hypothetical protein
LQGGRTYQTAIWCLLLNNTISTPRSPPPVWRPLSAVQRTSDVAAFAITNHMYTEDQLGQRVEARTVKPLINTKIVGQCMSLFHRIASCLPHPAIALGRSERVMAGLSSSLKFERRGKRLVHSNDLLLSTGPVLCSHPCSSSLSFSSRHACCSGQCLLPRPGGLNATAHRRLPLLPAHNTMLSDVLACCAFCKLSFEAAFRSADKASDSLNINIIV